MDEENAQSGLCDQIFKLPLELRRKIVTNITDVRLRTRLRLVCKEWKAVIDDPRLWRNIKLVIYGVRMSKMKILL